MHSKRIVGSAGPVHSVADVTKQRVRWLDDFAPYNLILSDDGVLTVLDLPTTSRIVSPCLEIARFLFMLEFDARRRASAPWKKAGVIRMASIAFVRGYEFELGRGLGANEVTAIRRSYSVLVMKRVWRRLQQYDLADTLAVSRRLICPPAIRSR